MLATPVHAAGEMVVIGPEPGADTPLLDPSGQPLGPRVTVWQFCELAAAGEGIVDGVQVRVADQGREVQVDCRRTFPRLARKMPVSVTALGRSRFVKTGTDPVSTFLKPRDPR